MIATVRRCQLLYLYLLVGMATAATSPKVISRGKWSGNYQAFPDLCRLKNGDLLCVFYAGYGHVSLPREGWPLGGCLCSIRSRDEGRTWSQPRVLFDGPDDDRDPHIAQMQDGTLYCSFFPYRRLPSGKLDHEVCLLTSRDGARTWATTPQILAPHWAVSAPVRELPDGTRILGIYREEAKTAYGGALRSTDQGRSWSPPIPIAKDSGVRLDAETDFILTQDGALLAALRGDRTNLHFATSPDRGLTWSGVVDSGFKGHCPHFCRLTSGTILLSHRLPNTALHFSRDEGKTWQGPFEIDSPIGAYPSTVELSDGSVLVVYYEEGDFSGIRQRRFRVSDHGLEFLEWEPHPINLGSRRELFADSALLDTLKGAELKLQVPTAKEVAIQFDQPWEGRFSGYVTVLHAGEKYQMYYRGNPLEGADGSESEVTCYAESPDGVRWTKPDLGLFEVHGTRKNNVLLAGQSPFSHNFAPFIDRRPDCPAHEKYKALAGTSAQGLFGFVSPDGLRWTKIQAHPLVTEGAFDSQNVAFWAESEGKYVLYLRTWTQGEFKGFRTVSRSESSDFLNWSRPQPMDFGETPYEHLYTSQTHPYFRSPHFYISIPMRFLPGRTVLSAAQSQQLNVSKNYAADCAEAVFMTSRGGLSYDRTFLDSFIRPGLDTGNWASRAGLTALGVVPTGPQEISLYKQAHYAQPSSHLIRYALRTDGFSSLHASWSGGEGVTQPLIFSGRQLSLNLSTGAAGKIQVEILNSDKTPLKGFSKNDAPEIIGDELDYLVRWRSHADLASLAGKPVRLRFLMADADIYSFQFVP